MNIIAWNIRGIANRPSERRLKKLVKLNNIGCLAIFEPKLDKSHINELTSKLKCDDAFSNQEGNIWVIWKSDISCSILHSCAQYVTVRILILLFHLCMLVVIKM